MDGISREDLQKLDAQLAPIEADREVRSSGIDFPLRRDNQKYRKQFRRGMFVNQEIQRRGGAYFMPIPKKPSK